MCAVRVYLSTCSVSRGDLDLLHTSSLMTNESIDSVGVRSGSASLNLLSEPYDSLPLGGLHWPRSPRRCPFAPRPGHHRRLIVWRRSRVGRLRRLWHLQPLSARRGARGGAVTGSSSASRADRFLVASIGAEYFPTERLSAGADVQLRGVAQGSATHRDTGSQVSGTFLLADPTLPTRGLLVLRSYL